MDIGWSSDLVFKMSMIGRKWSKLDYSAVKNVYYMVLLRDGETDA